MWKRWISMLCLVAMLGLLLGGCGGEAPAAPMELTEEEKLYHAETQPSVKMDNGKTLSFNLFKTSTLASQENISFKDYINAKMKHFERYMADLDTYVNSPMTYPDPA